MNRTESTVLVHRFVHLVWLIFYVVEGFLLFRFLLRLIGANAGAPFVNFIYEASYPLVYPFLYIVGSPRLADMVIEWHTLIALLFYWFIAWIIVRLIYISRPVRAKKIENEISSRDHL